MPDKFASILQNTRRLSPLIHCITNYVTANDTANLLLASGARPIMADDPMEVEQVVSQSCGLTINIGTLNSRTAQSMLLAGKRANALKLPVVIDPVGAGSSEFRTSTAKMLVSTLNVSALRANMSEIKAVLGADGSANGVDAAAADSVDESNLDDSVSFLKQKAREAGMILAATGAIDLVADGNKCYVIKNGRPEMARVTGTGCQLSALCCAFMAANKQSPLEAAAAAVSAMGLAGEIALSRMQNGDGNNALRGYIIDAIYNLTPDKLLEGTKYEIR